MTTFCVEHEISRKTFYALRARAREEGPAAVLQPRSRKPRSSPSRISEELKDQAIEVRAALEASGLDHGPISVHDRMHSMGLDAPSIAALARTFRERDVARLQPRKKPRAAWRRFVYPAPNACWQLDATEYVLTRGRKCVIFQLQDDHSRLAVASIVAGGESSRAAVAVFNKGVRAYGVPQRLLTDNGVAMNPSRRGWDGRLVTRATSLGVETITGKPYKPTTQGKNERFHQTLFRWLDKQPIADSVRVLQGLVDEFDLIYNTQRPHQGLPGRITPQQAWDTTPIADSPRPPPTAVEMPVPAPLEQSSTPVATPVPAPLSDRARVRIKKNDPEGQRHRIVGKNGAISVKGIIFQVSHPHAGHVVLVVWDPAGVRFIDEAGVILAEHAWPPAGVRYVSGHGPDPTGRRGGRPRKNPGVSPKS